MRRKRKSVKGWQAQSKERFRKRMQNEGARELKRRADTLYNQNVRRRSQSRHADRRENTINRSTQNGNSNVLRQGMKGTANAHQGRRCHMAHLTRYRGRLSIRSLYCRRLKLAIVRIRNSNLSSGSRKGVKGRWFTNSVKNQATPKCKINGLHKL